MPAPLRSVSSRIVHKDINAGRLRCILFGSVRRVRPEDVEAYVQARIASRPPAGEDWYTIADLIRTTGLGRSRAYRLLARGIVPFQVFSGTRYVRSTDLPMLLRRS